MQEAVTLKEIERRAFVSYHADGLLDIYIGVMLLLTPLSVFLKNNLSGEWVGTAVTIGLIGCACTGYILLKRHFTLTRLGMAEFGAFRRRRKNILCFVLAVSVAITLALFTFSMAVWHGYVTDVADILNNPVLLGTFLAVKLFVVLSLIAFFLDFTRGYLIGAILGLSVGLDITFNQPLFPLAGGVILSVIGTVYFIRFLRNNPVPEIPEGEGVRGLGI